MTAGAHVSEVYEEVRAQHWLAKAFDVLTVDAVWTRQLNAEDMSREDMRDAANLGEVLYDEWLLLTSPDSLEQVATYLQTHAEWVIQEAARHEFVETPHDLNAFMEMVRRATSFLAKSSDRESAALRQKFQDLRAGTWARGDLTPRARCSILFLGAGVALRLGLPDMAGGMWAWFLASKCKDILLGLPEGGE
jgi:hypothetical protein